MTSGLVITHERRANRAGALRPRLKGRGVRLVETRSVADLTSAVVGHPVPIVVMDVGEVLEPALEALEAVGAVAPDALTVVLDPGRHPGLPVAARELGATLVLQGVVTPPRLADLVLRWVELAAGRAGRAGWFPGPPAESGGPTPWERLLAGEDPAPFLDALLQADMP